MYRSVVEWGAKSTSMHPERQVRRGSWVPYVAGAIGTFGLVFAGCGAIMMNTLSSGQVTHVGVGLVFGLIITVMIYTLGHLSGAHFPLRRLEGYWAAQLGGAILAAGCLRLLFGDVAYQGTTIPAGSGGAWQFFELEALITFLLMFVIMAMATDTRAVGQAAALVIGATFGLAALFAGPIRGASMNHTHSLGLALMSWTWTDQWVYLLTPLLGAVVGAYAQHWLRESSNVSPSLKHTNTKAT